MLLHAAGDTVSSDVLRDALGALAVLPVVLRAVDAEQWPRTRKGDVDRRAAQALVR